MLVLLQIVKMLIYPQLIILEGRTRKGLKYFHLKDNLKDVLQSINKEISTALKTN